MACALFLTPVLTNLLTLCTHCITIFTSSSFAHLFSFYGIHASAHERDRKTPNNRPLQFRLMFDLIGVKAVADLILWRQ